MAVLSKVADHTSKEPKERKIRTSRSGRREAKTVRLLGNFFKRSLSWHDEAPVHHGAPDVETEELHCASPEPDVPEELSKELCIAPAVEPELPSSVSRA